MSASRELVSAATDERGVTTLTLNRPDKGNAYVLAMIHRLMAEIERSGASPEVRAIVLRGAGKRAFCPGADISEFSNARATAAQAEDYGNLIRDTLEAIGGCRHPVVAMKTNAG